MNKKAYFLGNLLSILFIILAVQFKAYAAFPLSALKTWADREVLTHTDLNNEFNRVYATGLTPVNIDDLSSNSTNHQATSDPTSGLPTSLREEIQELRWQLDKLVGGTYWYDAPTPESQGYQNILPNGSFEWWSNGEDNQAPDGWSLLGTPTDVSRDTGETDYFGGISAAKITSGGSGHEGISRTLDYLKASTTYYVWARLKATAGDTAKLWTTGASSNLSQTATATSFTTVTGSFTTDSTPTDVVLKVGSDTVSDIVWFDKLMVVEGVFPTTFGQHSGGAAAPGYFKNLAIESTSVTSVDVDIDYVVVENTNSDFILLAGIDETVDITVSGVNGLDTGAKTNIGYAIWVIYNSTTGATDSLISSSFSAPTMPSNYDYKKLVSFFRNKSGNILPFHQRNEVYQYDAPTEPGESTTVLSAGSDVSYTDVECINFTGSALICRTAIIGLTQRSIGATPTGKVRIRPDGATGEGKIVMNLTDEKAERNSNEVWITLTGANNVFEYKAGHADVDVSIEVVGCILDI